MSWRLEREGRRSRNASTRTDTTSAPRIQYQTIGPGFGLKKAPSERSIGLPYWIFGVGHWVLGVGERNCPRMSQGPMLNSYLGANSFGYQPRAASRPGTC